MVDPEISVVLMTYNHGQYVGQAVESVLGQRLDCPWELIITEDCSTDGTRDLVRQYADQHPDRIQLMLSTSNLRSNAVVSRAIHGARGRYVALIDGDDYWTSPDKLAVQREFLEAHPDAAICFHSVDLVDELGRSLGRASNRPTRPMRTTLAELSQGNYLATCSVMYRRELVPRIPDWYDECFPITDWPLHMLFAERGWIGFIDRVMAAYRQHAEGWFSPAPTIDKMRMIAAFYDRVDQNVEQGTRELMRRGRLEFFAGWVERLVAERSPRDAARCLRWAWQARPYRSASSMVRFLRASADLALRWPIVGR